MNGSPSKLLTENVITQEHGRKYTVSNYLAILTVIRKSMGSQGQTHSFTYKEIQIWIFLVGYAQKISGFECMSEQKLSV